MKQKRFKTKDIYLSAVLMALGAKLEATNRTDPRHQEFEFSSVVDDVVIDENKQLDVQHGVDFELVERQYANAELMINAVKFKESLQRMKSVVHSQ